MDTYNGNDIYCDLIIPRTIDISVVKETEHILAFHHTNPNWPTHIVVLPKEHVDSFLTLDLNGDIAKDLLGALQDLAHEVTANEGSCRVITNLGEYQDSKHLHVHIASGNPLNKV